MAIRNQIAAIVSQMTSGQGNGAPSFLYGTEKELNAFADDVTSWPVVFMYSLEPVSLEFTNNNSINDSYSIYVQFLFKTEFGEYTSGNEVYITQALRMAKEFMLRLKDYRETDNKYFRVPINQKGKGVPVYNKFDVNTTGIGLTLTLQTMENEAII